MSHAGSPSVASDDESKSKMPASIPKTALRPLEPEAGGSWSVTGQAEDAFALTYQMNGTPKGISFYVRPCTNEKDIRAHCGHFFYDINSPEEFSAAPVNPNRHAIDKMLLDGKKHKRPLKANTSLAVHGINGQRSDTKKSSMISLGDQTPATAVNGLSTYEIPVSSVTSVPLTSTAAFVAPQDHELGLSLLEQYNHNSATPSGAVPFHQALSAEMLAIEQQSMALEQQHFAYDQQCMGVEQSFMVNGQQAMTTHQPAIVEGHITAGQDPIPAHLNDPFFAPVSDANWAFFDPKESWAAPFTTP